jgi:ATP-dependent 26S proteasome regulatory subunit
MEEWFLSSFGSIEDIKTNNNAKLVAQGKTLVRDILCFLTPSNKFSSGVYKLRNGGVAMPLGLPKDNNSTKQGVSDLSQREEQIIQWSISAPRYDMKDMILATDTLRELEDVISYIQNKDKLFNEWGLAEKYRDRDCLTVNFYGASGTGKTMAAHAISKAIGANMICVDYADIESKYVGETSKNLSSLFKMATASGAVIFFDEADALLSKRVTNMTSATDVSVNQTRSVLLTLLNDYRGVIIFATNFIQNFDAAFLRRIRYHIQFHLPDEQLREKLWRCYIPNKMPLHSNVSCQLLAEKFNGISGSDIANAVFSAAVSAMRNNEELVTQEYFDKAVQSCINVKRANQGTSAQVTRQVINAEEAKAELGLKEAE